MRFLLVSLAPLSEAFLLRLFRRAIRISVAGIRKFMVLNVYVLLFMKQHHQHWGSWIPSSSCVHDLKRERKGEKKKMPCVMKKINFPFL